MRRGTSRPTKPPVYVSRQFTLDEIEQGIAKLRRRIEEVTSLAADRVQYSDPRREIAALSLRETIREVFGEESAEYDGQRYHRFWDGPMRVGMRDHELQAGFEAGIRRSVAILEGLIRRLEEKRADFQQNEGARATATLRGFDLHPRIAGVVSNLYENGHYASAVREATIALETMIKERTGRHDLTGPALMRTALSPDRPILLLNDLSDQTGRDEQEGFMHILAGVALGIRNPFAHALPEIDAQRAMEYIVLISLLAKRMEEARRSEQD